FRPNPEFDCFEAITQLGVGEALVSTLGEKGIPSMVQRTLIRPPSSRLGPISDAERERLIAESPLAGQYDRMVDRESAYEILTARAEAKARSEEAQAEREASAEVPGRGRTRWTLPDFHRNDDDDDQDRYRSRQRSSRQTGSRRT